MDSWIRIQTLPYSENKSNDCLLETQGNTNCVHCALPSLRLAMFSCSESPSYDIWESTKTLFKYFSCQKYKRNQRLKVWLMKRELNFLKAASKFFLLIAISEKLYIDYFSLDMNYTYKGFFVFYRIFNYGETPN